MNRWTYLAVRSQNRAARQARGHQGKKWKLGRQRRLWGHAAKAFDVLVAGSNCETDPEGLSRGSGYAEIGRNIYSYGYVMPRGELKRELRRSLRQGHKGGRRHGKTGSGIVLMPPKDIRRAQNQPNGRPGQCLNFATPAEGF